MSLKISESRVLVTGCDGFLGRRLAEHFASLGASVLGIGSTSSEVGEVAFRRVVCPLERVALGDLLRDAKPDLCLHAAGPASVPASVQDPLGDFQRAVPAVVHVLEALRLLDHGCRFLLLSSAAVYGNPERLPVEEARPAQPISPYGFHKWMAELAVAEYRTVFGVPAASARIFSAYGPGLRKQVVWDLCQRAVKKGALHVFGTGSETRDFIHADDAVRALAAIAEGGAFQGEVTNLGSSEETSIRQVAGWVAEEAGLPEAPIFDGGFCEGAPLNWQADTTRLRGLGWEPRIAAEAGLRETIKWCLDEGRKG